MEMLVHMHLFFALYIYVTEASTAMGTVRTINDIVSGLSQTREEREE